MNCPHTNITLPFYCSFFKNFVFECVLQETKHSTLTQIVEQDSDSESSAERLDVDETTLGLSGALAQMANMTFLAGAPGNVKPGLVQVSAL